ncbi:MAG: hypothetical protein M0R50_09945 [Candidatus Cloacimonetes bacterium]|jgi:hypothetical protein|nr:hypothetical protein [Candidatus Cloacimonadota bacterium]
MLGDNKEQLPEDLKEMAKLFSNRYGCKCDISVGHICEMCLVYNLMIGASDEITNLRSMVKTKDKADISNLPIAENTSMTFVGRNIYTIIGMPGLYWLKNDRDSDKPTISARRKCTRGANWSESTFTRIYDIEERLKLVMMDVQK